VGLPVKKLPPGLRYYIFVVPQIKEYMDDNITARDQVWAAITRFEPGVEFTIEHIRSKISPDSRPSDETIRRTLRSATELDAVLHKSNSPYYYIPTKYVNESTHSCRKCGKEIKRTRWEIIRYSNLVTVPGYRRRNVEGTYCAYCIKNTVLLEE
jgi:hypothetical protein